MIMIITAMVVTIKIITTIKTTNKEIINKDQIDNNQTDQTDKTDHITNKTDAQISKTIKKGNGQKAESLLRGVWIHKTHKQKNREQITRKVIIKSNKNKRADKYLTQLEQKTWGKENLKDDRTYSETKSPKSEKQKTVTAKTNDAAKKGV